MPRVRGKGGATPKTQETGAADSGMTVSQGLPILSISKPRAGLWGKGACAARAGHGVFCREGISLRNYVGLGHQHSSAC